ncbi:MAG: guanylate kinase [Planctomycetes bacterium]|nr:guanylate kinase [Planctomycetota bacterium]
MSSERPIPSGPPGGIVVISGPSGVGKSTIVRQAVGQTGVEMSVSATTRRPRPGEKDGVDYRFVDREQFERMTRQDELLEWAKVFDNYYGTPAGPVRKAVEQGKTIVLNIDVQGGQQVAQTFPGATFILILPPGEKALAERLAGRKTETPEQLKARLSKAMEEIRQAKLSGVYNHEVVNDSLADAVRQVVGIIKESRKT